MEHIARILQNLQIAVTIVTIEVYEKFMEESKSCDTVLYGELFRLSSSAKEFEKGESTQ